jgi:hypothetical protein
VHFSAYADDCHENFTIPDRVEDFRSYLRLIFPVDINIVDGKLLYLCEINFLIYNNTYDKNKIFWPFHIGLFC